MNVLFLIKRPLTERDFFRFGMADALERGYRVFVLDLSLAIHPDLSNSSQSQFAPAGIAYHAIPSWAEFATTEPLFREADVAFLLIQSFGLSRATYRPLRMLARTSTPYVIFAPAVYPGLKPEPANVGVWRWMLDVATRLRNADLVTSLMARLGPRPFAVAHADWTICGSECSRQLANSLVGRQTRAVATHTADYETYREIRSRPLEEARHAVFIDQWLPFHEDYSALGAHPIDSQKYYEGLRSVFDRIEKRIGLPVVIAAHPKSEYEAGQNLFGNRRIIYGNTAELIARSRLVMAHTSTAIGFAVLFRKPIMLLASRELYERHVYEKYVYEGLSRELGASLQFFDCPASMDFSVWDNVDGHAYERYTRNYLRCSDAPDQPMWETIWHAINSSRTVLRRTGNVVKKPSSVNEKKESGMQFEEKLGW